MIKHQPKWVNLIKITRSFSLAMILRSGFIQIENVNNLAFYRRQNRNGIAWKKKNGKSFFSGLPGWIHGYLELNFAIISYLNALFAFTQNPFNRRTYIFAFFFRCACGKCYVSHARRCVYSFQIDRIDLISESITCSNVIQTHGNGIHIFDHITSNKFWYWQCRLFFSIEINTHLIEYV